MLVIYSFTHQAFMSCGNSWKQQWDTQHKPTACAPHNIIWAHNTRKRLLPMETFCFGHRAVILLMLRACLLPCSAAQAYSVCNTAAPTGSTTPKTFRRQSMTEHLLSIRQPLLLLLVSLVCMQKSSTTAHTLCDGDSSAASCCECAASPFPT